MRRPEKTVLVNYTGTHPLRFTQSGDALPSGLAFDPGSGRISGTPRTGDQGIYNITIGVEETGAASPLSASRSFTLTVTDTQTDPVLKLAQPDDDTVAAGEPYRKTLSAAYDGAGSLTYSATGLAPGLSITGASGEISGTPTADGVYRVHIAVTDGTLNDNASYTLTVVGSGTPPVDPPPTTPSGGGSTHSPGDSSSGGSALTIDHERITPLGLLSVRWDGQPLIRGTDYGVYQGSVIIRFDADFIAAQAPGAHTVRVEFLNHTGETGVTVKDMAQGGEAASRPGNDTYNPSTGGDPGSGNRNPNTGAGTQHLWLALMLSCLSAAALLRYAAKR